MEVVHTAVQPTPRDLRITIPKKLVDQGILIRGETMIRITIELYKCESQSKE